MFLKQNMEIFDTELWEILEALSIGGKMAKIGSIPIKVFCDLQRTLKAITLLFICQKDQFLRVFIYQKAGELQDNRHPITFQWIPSHSGFIKNDKGDLVAKDRAGKGKD